MTTEDGTGIVHISPTFGADDFRAAQLADIPALMVPDAEGTLGPIVDRTGRYVPQMGEFAGRWVKNYDGHDESGADYKTLDESIVIKMKGDGTAFKVERVRAHLPALLAHRQARALLPARFLVHQDHGGEGPAHRAQ